jgi:hypothetical protein
MPLLDLQRRLKETGRIRIGTTVKRNGKAVPTKLSTFRLTSPSKDVLDAAAVIYGGEVHPWADAPTDQAQFELVTGSDTLDAIVPPGSYLTQHYEMWSGGGCVRRCDGEREQLSDRPCLCPDDYEERNALAAQGKACKATTRLSLLLYKVPDLGLWRLETHGWNAAVELAGAQQIAAMATARGYMIPVRLRLEQRERRTPGQPTKKFAVPVLDVPVTFGEIIEHLGLDTAAPLALSPIGPEAGAEIEGPPPPADTVRSRLEAARRPKGALADGLEAVEKDPLPEEKPKPKDRQRHAAPVGPAAPLGDAAFGGDDTPSAEIGETLEPTPDDYVPVNVPMATNAQKGALHGLAKKLGLSDEQKHRAAGVASFNDLTKEAASILIDAWGEELASKDSADPPGAADTPEEPKAGSVSERSVQAPSGGSSAPPGYDAFKSLGDLVQAYGGKVAATKAAKTAHGVASLNELTPEQVMDMLKAKKAT